MSYKSFPSFLFLLVASLGLFGCLNKPFSSTQPKADDRPAATVNGQKITVGDLKKELTFMAKHNPSIRMDDAAARAQLSVMIDKKLLIEEAVKRNLSQEEDFIHTVKLYWEQTLIKNLMKVLAKQDEAGVAETEIQNIYGRLGQRVSFQWIQAADRSLLEAVKVQSEGGTEIEWKEALPPMGFMQVYGTFLEKPFEMSEGEVAIVSDDKAFYLIRVVKKEAVEPPAFDEALPQIQNMIRRKQDVNAIQRWIENKKKNSQIKIEDFTLRETDQ